MRKVNTVMYFRYGWEIDNQVGTRSEPCKHPHSFLQNSFPSSSSPEAGSSSSYGMLLMVSPMMLLILCLLSHLLIKKSIRKKDSTNLVDPSPPKDSFSPPFAEKVHKPLPPFPYRLKKKDQAHIYKMKEIFSQVKISIPLLNAIQSVLPYVRFLKDLCTTKRATSVPKKAFLASGTSSIILH